MQLVRRKCSSPTFHLDCSMRQWESADRLNDRTKVTPDVCQYVVLLNQTYNFNVEKDLKQTLKINKKPLVWFVHAFQRCRVSVEYTTLFTQKELQTFGPIATEQSNGIVVRLFQKKYDASTTKLVGLKWHVKRLWGERQTCPYDIVHPDEFRETLAGATRDGTLPHHPW